MESFSTLKPGNKKYLLIPVMPTPNGGLHLGHLSGPYLKMDVLARAQRRNGNNVAVFFGSDAYESYMNLKAWQTGKEVKQLCIEFHSRMTKDLDALKIGYDAFINPLADEHRESFSRFFQNIVSELVDKGVVELRDEKYFYSKEEDCFLAGCWISGDCPVCGTGTGSYQCEDCGTQYRPMDLISPTFRRGNHSLTKIDDKDLYLVITKKDELLQHLKNMQVGEEFLEIAKTYFEHQGNYVRLTNPSNWGIPWKIEGSNIPHVLFTYSALYFYSMYCGELYQEKLNLPLNPFHKDADVTTVASFGIDCTVPYLVAGVGLGIQSGYRPIDHLLPNHFFTLENSKFSTSRGHAIWGNDLINKTPVSPDAVRYFLALNNPEHGMADFNVAEFVSFISTGLAGDLQSTLFTAWAAIKEQPTVLNEELTEKLERLLILQHDCLTPPGFELRSSIKPLHDWLATTPVFNDENTAYWWLKGFALLAFPIMPDCATSTWHLLGHKNEPLETEYFLQPQVLLEKQMPVYFEVVSFDELRPALPETLFATELK